MGGFDLKTKQHRHEECELACFTKTSTKEERETQTLLLIMWRILIDPNEDRITVVWLENTNFSSVLPVFFPEWYQCAHITNTTH